MGRIVVKISVLTNQRRLNKQFCNLDPKVSIKEVKDPLMSSDYPSRYNSITLTITITITIWITV